MNTYYRQYSIPGLQDVGAFGIPADQASRYRDQINSQGHIFQEREIPRFLKKPIVEMTVYDPSSDQSLLGWLNSQAQQSKPLMIGNGGVSGENLVKFNQKKAALTSPDWLTDVANLKRHSMPSVGRGGGLMAQVQRSAQADNFMNADESINAGNRAIDALRGLSQKAGVSLNILPTDQLLNEGNRILAITGKEPYPAEAADFLGGFYYPRANAIYVNNNPAFSSLDKAHTIAHELGHAFQYGLGNLDEWHYPAGTNFQKVKNPGEVWAEIHAESAGHGILDQVLPKSYKYKPLLHNRSIDFIGNLPYSNHYADPLASIQINDTDALKSYMAYPEFGNQIRDAVKYAGRLLL